MAQGKHKRYPEIEVDVPTRCSARSPEGHPCARPADHRGNHYTSDPHPTVVWGYVPPLTRGPDGLWR